MTGAGAAAGAAAASIYSKITKKVLLVFHRPNDLSRHTQFFRFAKIC